jgi:hypothetical protein
VDYSILLPLFKDVLLDLVNLKLYVFIDIIIFINIKELAARLTHALELFENKKLQLQPSKCKFTQPQVKYLGYIVSKEGIKATSENTRAVKIFSVPKKTKRNYGSTSALPRFTVGCAQDLSAGRTATVLLL